MGDMKLARGPSRLWAHLHRLRLVRGHMPFWRVVVEARLNRAARDWPADQECAVAAIFVWARTIEEAEGLASLALEEEGLSVVTADAMKHPPAAVPRKAPTAVARTAYRFLPRIDADARSEPPSRRGARA